MHHHISSSRKVVADNLGHAANMDRPEIFNTAALEFLEQL